MPSTPRLPAVKHLLERRVLTSRSSVLLAIQLLGPDHGNADVVAALGMKKNTVTVICNDLQKDGLISIGTPMRDGRQVFLNLEPAGQEACACALQSLRELTRSE